MRFTRRMGYTRRGKGQAKPLSSTFEDFNCSYLSQLK